MVIHAPLNEDRRETRLVRFLPPPAAENESPPDKIALKIKTVQLDDEISYEALSYVWGDPTDTVEIEVNGAPFAVTRNLHSGLKQLQQFSVDSWLWIDAVCIDQSNLSEKSHQINAMRDIFSGAARVYTYLGPGTDETDLVMDLVVRFGPRLRHCDAPEMKRNWDVSREIRRYVDAAKALPDGEEPPDGPDLGRAAYELYRAFKEKQEKTRDGMEDILARSYWNRVWIIQEVVLAQQVVVVIGSGVATLDAFDAMIITLWSVAFYDLGLSGTMYRTRSIETRRARLEGLNGARLSDILWETGIAPGRPHYAASDPRDLVFGLLGIVDEEQRQGLRADYSLSYADVFTQVTRAMLELKGPGYSQFRLDAVNPKGPDYDGQLPTWVPDWREIGEYGVPTYPTNHSPIFHATRDKSQAVQRPQGVAEEDHVLRRWGCVVDRVTEVMEPPTWTQIDPYSASFLLRPDDYFRSIVAFAGLGPNTGPGEDYVWRTVMRDSDMHRASHRFDCDDCAVTEAVRALARKVMRVESLDSVALTAEEEIFIRRGPWLTGRDAEDRVGDRRMQVFGSQWRQSLGRVNRNRTFFKTTKGMFGLGHVGIEPGDIVTLIWGLDSPIILRHRDEGGFFFRGDAYVDGIMQGEYLDNNPREEEFALH